MPWENRPEEVARLESAARLALQNAERLHPTQFVTELRPSLRVWSYPAFDIWISWTLFEPAPRLHPNAKVDHVSVREVTWDRPHDFARFSDPLEGVRQGFHSPPTIRIRDGELPVCEFNEWLLATRQVTIPIVGIETPIVLDGGSAGLESYDLFLPVRLEWWGEGPTAWRMFVARIDMLRHRLQECFA